ncbi:MAG: glucosamine inositolphosphorylceramide transferase family protein [Rickettsiales bacterium]
MGLRFRPATELWHVGITRTPITSFVHAPTAPQVTWLPQPKPFCFVADPFGHVDDAGNLTILVEALDYRIKRGEIHYYRYDKKLTLCDTGTALRAPYHLSYPFLLQHDGYIYMLPEAHRSGRLTLYRTVDFPSRWEVVASLLDLPVIDASVIQCQDRWWMFFALAGEHGRAMNELHIAYADSLFGPWQLHPKNPVRRGLDSSRMGGTPFIHEASLYLPMQDCRDSYGGALRLLRVDSLTSNDFAAEVVRDISPNVFASGYEGCHTLSACFDFTLFDVKNTQHSPQRHLIDWQRRIKRVLPF